ncbi:MAG: hypothetical protein LBU79_06825 [Planctomycetota bacterium]|jgi:ABC-type Fe3+ transport system substrate-binding protein|nr:hypothetical protein [Planctomycetota bacterium]
MKKNHLPVAYLLVAAYIIFSAFDLLEKQDVTLEQKLSYLFIVIVPLTLIIISVWLMNRGRAEGNFAPTAIYLPLGLASILLGVGVILGGGWLVLGVVVGLLLGVAGLNRLRYLFRPARQLRTSLPAAQARRLAGSLPYEYFPKIQVENGGPEAGNLPAHLFLAEATGMTLPVLIPLQDEETSEPLPYQDSGASGAITLAINPQVVAVKAEGWKKRLGIEAGRISTLETLLSPNLRAAYVLPDPESGQEGFLLLAGLIQSLGQAEGLELFQRLAANARRLLPPAEVPPALAADPELIAGVGFLGDFLVAPGRSGWKLSIPAGSAWTRVIGGIPADSPDPAESATLLRYLIGRRGNELLASRLGLAPVHPKALFPPGAPSAAAGGPNPAFSSQAAWDQREEILRLWRGLPKVPSLAGA